MNSYQSTLPHGGQQAPCFRRTGLRSAVAAASSSVHGLHRHGKHHTSRTHTRVSSRRAGERAADSAATHKGATASSARSAHACGRTAARGDFMRREAVEDGGIHLPSDFDASCYKGCVFGGRHARPVDSNPLVGPGSYEVYHSTLSDRTTRFETGPFEELALRAEAAKRRRRGSTREQQDAQARAARPALQVRYMLVETNPPTATLQLSVAKPEHDKGTPGPGCYVPKFEETKPNSRSTVFYRGSFAAPINSRSGGGACALAEAGGPGATYNVETMYSNSTRVNVLSGRGATFGIQYPARALRQVCKPRDETTNVNCEYEQTCAWKSTRV